MLRLQAASELNQRPDQEVAKTQPRHNASPLQTPAQVRKGQKQLSHTIINPLDLFNDVILCFIIINKCCCLSMK